MATNIINRSYYGAAERGRTDRDEAQMRQARNVLASQEVTRGADFQALSRNPQATPDQYARVGRSDVANALTNQANQASGLEQDKAKRLFTAAQYALQSQTPKALLQQNFPDIVALNPNFANETDDQVKQQMQGLLAQYGARLGVAPQAPEPQFEQMRGPNGSTIVKRGDKWQVIEPPKAQQATATFRTLSPKEIQDAGLPPGTSAQVGADGKIDVLSKRDNTGTLSQKDQTTAKQKLVTVQLAKQQLARIRERFAKIQGTMSAGAFGQGRMPTEGGRSFDAAVDQMRSTLTALTRTPGVGAMSDYETKLDQAKFPARTNYESVTAEQIQAIEDQLALIESGYTGLLQGNASSAAPQQQAVQQSAPQVAPQGSQPVRVNSRDEAMALPSGTRFVTPDGRVKVRP